MIVFDYEVTINILENLLEILFQTIKNLLIAIKFTTHVQVLLFACVKEITSDNSDKLKMHPSIGFEMCLRKVMANRRSIKPTILCFTNGDLFFILMW